MAITAYIVLVIVGMFLSVLTYDLLKLSALLEACRKVVKSAKRLVRAIKHWNK